MSRRLLLALVGVAGLLTFTSAARAVDLHDVLIDYTMTSWNRKDGLTGPIWAIEQDTDGFLWLGTEEGLVRFDGVRFVPWETLNGSQLPHSAVRALHIAHDGSLWVGFAAGGVARIQGKNVQLVSQINDTDTGLVTAIVEDHHEGIWVAGSGGLFLFNENRWEQLGSQQDAPESGYLSAYVDSAGTVWVGTESGSFRRPESDQRFQPIDTATGMVRSLSISADPKGGIWTSDPIDGFRPLDDRVPPRSTQSGRGYRLLHDRDGNLWVATIGQGLWRVRNAGDPAHQTIEKATVLSGLSSDAARSVFEDRDSNIWVGTTEGLDRLVPHRITPLTGMGIVSTIDASESGYVWVGTEDELTRFSRVNKQWQPDPVRIPIRGARLVRSSGRNTTWLLSTDSLTRVDGLTATHVNLPPGMLPSAIEAVASDLRGGLWAVADGQILHADGTAMQVVGHPKALTGHVTAATTDHTGRLWLAFGNTLLGVLSSNGQFDTYGPDQGLTGGLYYALHEDRHGAIWMSSSTGLSRFQNGKFLTIGRANGLPATGVYALAEDDHDDLWLATSTGVLRVAHSEIEAVVSDARYQMHFRVYDTLDGLAGFPVQLSDRNAVRAADGTLWFITSRGISIADPRDLVASRITPKITIDEILVNDVPLSDASLPAGAAKLQIEYTAPELTYPLRTRFRYRLDGFDTDWVDAGLRRQVLYTNLPPRHYTFRVAVSDDEGRWSTSENTWAFSIAPRFFQTWWFYLLTFLTLSGLIAAAWQLRLRQLRYEFSLVLGERVRLSRELHDTLLQSLVGLALEFDAVSKTIETSPTAARSRVVKIRERVEEYIREARRSIWSLRSSALETADLADALRASGERSTSDHNIDFRLRVVGAPQRQPANVEHQILRIGQEAILNAVRHGDPKTIEMELRYTADALVLRVSDDGCGFNPNRLPDRTTDHYGITTMSER
ncbi:MAG: histidine kinase, partial [Acidobacteriaceae bacterium]|nr:histidine kinase [Acidobacteriaceae bacterium]